MQTHNALQQHTNNLHKDLDSHNQKPACKPTKCNGYGQLYYVLTDQLSVGWVGWILPRSQSLVAQHDVTCDQAFLSGAQKQNRTPDRRWSTAGISPQRGAGKEREKLYAIRLNGIPSFG